MYLIKRKYRTDAKLRERRRLSRRKYRVETQLLILIKVRIGKMCLATIDNSQKCKYKAESSAMVQKRRLFYFLHPDGRDNFTWLDSLESRLHWSSLRFVVSSVAVGSADKGRTSHCLLASEDSRTSTDHLDVEDSRCPTVWLLPERSTFRQRWKV